MSQRTARPALNEKHYADPLTCLHELFETQADLYPAGPAVISDDHILTYKDLDIKANQLARYLKAQGAGPETFIALYFDRSVSPIVAILACLKAGAAYIPIDPTFPLERIRHILGEARPLLLLTESALTERAKEFFAGRITATDDDHAKKLIAGFSPERLTRTENKVSPSNLCYVIYTSGTTGRPKGVMTEHRNAVRYVLAFNEVCGTKPHDRVYQGFSLGFDGSVEEIWMAFSNGSALVVGCSSTPRFGNELGQFLAKTGVTYFSTVPTLLTTFTDPIPSLQLLILSGEVCPPELVHRWARKGLRILNVYGPTEATVNTSSAECIAGQPVTIGRGLTGYGLHVLNAQMQPVPPGETGELFISGETLARGYLGQPELTAERFCELSEATLGGSLRVYRTGDLVRQNSRGEFEFLGRTDSQVKIRGYRIELAEIESVLLEFENISSACVKVFEQDGLKELAAYIVLKNPALLLDLAAVLARLEARLPSYMIPTHLDILSEMPRLASGKVDRSRLRDPASPLRRPARTAVEPETELEARIASVWARIFKLPKVAVTDDFFTDLGGYSLLAAQMVTLLRSETQKHVTVREAYNHPTIRRLAGHLASSPNWNDLKEEAVAPSNFSATGKTSRQVFEDLSRLIRASTLILQTLSFYLLYGVEMISAAMVFALAMEWNDDRISTAWMLASAAGIALLSRPALILLSILAKWVVIGRYKPGKYPVWGFYYFRWWLVSRLQALSGIDAFAGTPFMPVYFRLMGAQVGKGCVLDSALCSAWDVLTIGDETSICADTQFLGYRVQNGMLLIGHVEIGSRCFIGVQSALGLNVQMEDDSRLDDQSLLADGQVIATGQARRGSPAQMAEVVVPEVPYLSEPASRFSIPIFWAHFAVMQIKPVLLFIPLLPILGLWFITCHNESWARNLLFVLGAAPLQFLIFCLYIAGLKRLVLNKVEPGIYSVNSTLYLRKWFVDDLMKVSRTLLLPLYTTIFLPPWLRLMGAKIGARAELSTVWYFSPELMDLGEEVFLADGSIVGGKRFFRGHFEIRQNRIGRRAFVGNGAIVPVGADLEEGCLLGVHSAPPYGAIPAGKGTEWLGSPSFALPRRLKVEGFDDTVKFKPTLRLWIERAVIDTLRIVIPEYILILLGALELETFWLLYERLGPLGMILMAPILGPALAVLCMISVAVLKKLVMGTFQPVLKPLWSRYVFLNEMINGVYETLMAPALVPFLGTPFAGPLLRLMGCRIGKGTFIETTYFSEFDLVQVGDFAALNLGAIIQTHLFEDRIMKSSHLKIGAECTVGNLSVILYDSEMQTGAFLGPMSLLMKGESLAAFTRSHGIPVTHAPNSGSMLIEIPASIRASIKVA